MIDISSERKRELAFELQGSRVFEKRSKRKRAFLNQKHF